MSPKFAKNTIFATKKFILFIALVGILTSCERVDAGHEGILVNLYGSDKGVNDVSLVTGMVW